MNTPPRLAFVSILLLAACATEPKSPASAEVAAPSSMEVVPLKYAPAEELAATLTKLLGPSAPGQPARPMARVVADPRTNSLIVQASSEEMPRVLELIHRLDQKVE